MQIHMRPLTPEEIPVADAIAMSAYQSPSRAEEVGRYLRLQPDGWWLASAGERAVGLGGVIDYGPFAYVGLISVLPEMQRHSIGRALMGHILAWLPARGCPMVLLDASAVGEPLYAALGFVVDDASAVWAVGAEGAPPAPPPLAQSVPVVQPMTAADLAEVVAYDAPRFGAERGAVLADLLASYGDRAALTRDASGRVSGFAIAQRRVLGPWLADVPAAAAALLAWARRLESPPTSALVARQAASAAHILMAAGCTLQRGLAHMRLGGAGPRDRRTHYGLASFALG